MLKTISKYFIIAGLLFGLSTTASGQTATLINPPATCAVPGPTPGTTIQVPCYVGQQTPNFQIQVIGSFTQIFVAITFENLVDPPDDSCYFIWNRAGGPRGQVALFGDSPYAYYASSNSPWQGWAPGADISNSQCKLLGSAAQFTEGNPFNLTLPIQAQPLMEGTYKIYIGVDGGFNWSQPHGLWRPFMTNPPQPTKQIAPASGQGWNGVFDLSMSSAGPNGYKSIQRTLFIINNRGVEDGRTIPSQNQYSCYAIYHPTSHELFLLDDTGNIPMGNAQIGTSMGPSNIVQGSQCALDFGLSIYRNPDANTEVVSIPAIFTNSFGTATANFPNAPTPQTKHTYVLPIDRAGQGPSPDWTVNNSPYHWDGEWETASPPVGGQLVANLRPTRQGRSGPQDRNGFTMVDAGLDFGSSYNYYQPVKPNYVSYSGITRCDVLSAPSISVTIDGRSTVSGVEYLTVTYKAPYDFVRNRTTNKSDKLDVTCTINGILYSWDSIVVLDPTPVISSISPNQVATINQPVTLTFSGQGFGLLRPGVSVNPGVSFGTASFPTSPGITPNQGRQFTVPVTFSAGGTYSFYVTSNGVVSPGFAGGFGTAAGSVLNSSVSNVVTVSVCAPAISSIRVDGQNTNSIIAGMSGVISILGTCLSGNPTISGSGITLSSPLYTLNNQQLTMNYASMATATTGLQTITLGNNANLTKQVFTTKITLSSVEFKASYPITKDVPTIGGYPTPPPLPIQAPQWSASDTRPIQEPAAYSAGQTMLLSATFNLSPSPVNFPSFMLKGNVSGLGGTTMTNIVFVLSQTTDQVKADFSATNPFGTATKFYNPMDISWEVCNSACVSIGSSSNQVYVTLAPPLPSIATPIFRTPLHLAVSDDGAADRATAFAKTWAKFAVYGGGPANVKRWNYPAADSSLSYYAGGFSVCKASAAAGLLYDPNGYGQCASFASLLQHALAINGIASQIYKVEPNKYYFGAAEAMIVKNWGFGPSSIAFQPYGAGTPIWNWQMLLGTDDQMVEPGGIPRLDFGSDITNAVGLPGQNTNTPAEKVFGSHYIVYLDPYAYPGLTNAASGFGTIDPGCFDSPSDAPGPFFDPSYGQYYKDASSFECKSLEGYASRIRENSPGNELFYVRTRPTFVPAIPNPDPGIDLKVSNAFR